MSAVSILKLDVRVNEGVSIGDTAFIRVESKAGQRVRLAIFAARSVPIRLIRSGVMPESFSMGITGHRRVLEDTRSAVA